MTQENRTCANPECKCPAARGGDYCSDYCQDPTLPGQIFYEQPLDTGAKRACDCGHQGRLEEASKAKSSHQSRAS
jgi:hypothetical protein